MKRHNDQRIVEVLREFIQQDSIKQKYFETRIRGFWKDRFGKAIDLHTRSLRLKDQILKVELDSSPLRQELSMLKENLLSIINEMLEENYVKEIKLI